MILGEPRPIGYYCLGIYDGPHATPRESQEGPIFLGIKNFSEDGRLDLSDIRHVSEDDYPRWTRRVTPQPGDIVFTYEATLHRYALVPDGFRGCLGRRVGLVRPDPDRADGRYLLYHFLSRSWRDVVESNVVTGATVDRIPLEKFPYFPATLPGLEVQRRVADALSTYDNLIENNLRRTVLLEEAAQHLFHEWFGRLRFPGHEHIPVVAGVPDGWETRPLGECVRFRSGGTPSKQRSEYWDGPIPWVSSGEMTTTRLYDTSLHVSQDAVQNGRALAPSGTILIVVRGMSLAKEFRVTMVRRDMAFNQDLKALECQPDVDSEFLMHCLLAQREYIRGLASEAAHGTKKLDLAVLERLPILLPDARTQRHFREVVAALGALRDTLHYQTEKLYAARELLLPRLMSGELAA